MLVKTSKKHAPHGVWQSVCEAWSLVDAEGLSIKQERMPPGTAEVTHHHKIARQFFFVLSGALTMRAEDSFVTLRAGEGVEVPPGLPHQARNDGDGDVEFLVISAPGTAGDRWEDA